MPKETLIPESFTMRDIFHWLFLLYSQRSGPDSLTIRDIVHELLNSFLKQTSLYQYKNRIIIQQFSKYLKFYLRDRHSIATFSGLGSPRQLFQEFISDRKSVV